MTRRTFLAATGVAALAAAPRTRMGVATTSYLTVRKPKDTIGFLEYCNSLGAGGIQAALSSLETDYVRKLRGRAEQLSMYLEIMVGLPKQDPTAFERSVTAAKDAGALCIRSACLGGRRYENFSTLAEWNAFVAESHASIERAVPILEKHRMPMALENHKDWTADELAALMKRHSSEYLGVCLDTGNNIALLDDPMYTVSTLAPYAMSTHIKDMAVHEYPEGFLLSEVPLGAGMLDMRSIAGTIAKARPATRMTLEMITRNPLKVPCLTGKYWATFPERNGRYLADAIAMVRTRAAALPVMDGLAVEAQGRVEEENVKRCLSYARERLEL